jgi:primosomal protein N' (replication factor Y)
MVAEVLVPRPLYQSYTYYIPKEFESIAVPGMRVAVDFGHQKLTGLISSVKFSEPDPKLKPVSGFFESFPFVSESYLPLIRWISRYYLQPEGEASSLFVPKYQPSSVKTYKLKTNIRDILDSIPPRRAKFVERVISLNFLMGDDKGKSKEEILSRTGLSAQMWKELINDEWLLPVNNLPLLDRKDLVWSRESERFYPLTEKQKEAYLGITKNEGGINYLHGVTGSGKTEVYMHLVADQLEQGRGVIFLVPEISLTPQMKRQFYERFGDLVAIHHSGVTEQEKYINWSKLRSGEKKIVIGARSALFAPVEDLGLVILDEEGEGTYKQDTNPMYDARKVVEQINRMFGVSIVYGSATPSLNAWQRIRTGEWMCFDMPERVHKVELPKIDIVDFKAEFVNGVRSVFSSVAKKRMIEEFKKGNQVILFVPRRGHSSFVLCRACSHVLECERCKVSMTYHHGAKELHCHYCDKVVSMPKTCPKCSSSAIKYFGCGTQKVEEFFIREFPGVKVARLDTDVTRKKGVMEYTLQRMHRGEIQALIGTQMISKGLDFEKVSLIVILTPDGMVRMGDFSAQERAYQLFVQVAGRAGRRQTQGEVLLQTYMPDRKIYEQFKNHEFEQFMNEELYLRKETGFPPYKRLIQILSSSPDPNKASENLQKFYNKLTELLSDVPVELYPPQPSPIEKIENRWRFRSILKLKYDDEIWEKLFQLRMSYKPLYNTRLKVFVDADNLL